VDINFEMEERPVMKDHKDSEESSPPHPPLDNSKPNLQERVARKSKKDNLRDKKKGKKHLKEETNPINH
jgi:hypothetical protein